MIPRSRAVKEAHRYARAAIARVGAGGSADEAVTAIQAFAALIRNRSELGASRPHAEQLEQLIRALSARTGGSMAEAQGEQAGGGAAAQKAGQVPARPLGGANANYLEPQNFQQLWWLCQQLVTTGFMPKNVTAPGQAMALIMAGKEMGLGLMQSLRSLAIIEGAIGLKADLQLALMIRGGVRFEWLETTEFVARLRVERDGQKPAVFEFTIEQARQAGLVHKTKSGQPGMWEKYPAAMLRARVISIAGRAYAPDMLAGVYTPEELRGGMARDDEGLDEEIPTMAAAAAAVDFSVQPPAADPAPAQPTPPATVVHSREERPALPPAQARETIPEKGAQPAPAELRVERDADAPAASNRPEPTVTLAEKWMGQLEAATTQEQARAMANAFKSQRAKVGSEWSRVAEFARERIDRLPPAKK